MLVGMPSQRTKKPSGAKDDHTVNSASRRRVCTALTTSGSPCKRQAVAGLTVCRSHGGATAASVRAGKRASVSQEAARLWGINSDASGISVAEELTKLARNKMTDVIALRLELSSDKRHIGMLTESSEVTESEVGEEIYTTVKTKKGSGVSPWVAELHKAEQELLQILKLLHEVTGGTDAVDTKRLRMQTARETARIMKAFPGISVDDVAAEVSRSA